MAAQRQSGHGTLILIAYTEKKDEGGKTQKMTEKFSEDGTIPKLFRVHFHSRNERISGT